MVNTHLMTTTITPISRGLGQSPISLKSFATMREAVAHVDTLCKAYYKVHRKRETVNLMVSSYSPSHGLSRVPVELIEVRLHHDGSPEQIKQAAWFIAQP